MELENFSYDVCAVYNEEDAVLKRESNREIDLIHTDIDLGPGIDGTVAAEKNLGKRQIPKNFLSSHVEELIGRTTDLVFRLQPVLKYRLVLVFHASTLSWRGRPLLVGPKKPHGSPG